jgi:ABC-type transporter Mla subunit MlaD
MKRRRRRGNRLSDWVVGIIALVVIVCLTYLGFTKELPFQHHFQIKAAFANSNLIKKNSFVRIAGVNVGKVTTVEPLGGSHGGSLVTMRIEDNGQPIHTDATVKVRPRIFLEGNFFVDLDPGSPSAPIAKDGYTIPIQNAAAPVQLDQILGALQTNTREDLQTLLKEYGQGVFVGGNAYNRSIRFWRPAYQYSAEVNEATLGIQPHDLSNYIRDAGVVAESLDENPAALQSLVTDFNRTATAFSDQEQNLSNTIRLLPPTLRQAMPALSALNAAFPPTRRLARALLPAAQSTPPAVDAGLPFIQQLRKLVQPSELRGFVADLRPTVPALSHLTQQSIPLQLQVRAASSCQTNVILPWTHLTVPDTHFPAKGDVAYESVKYLPGIAGESTSGDANGQWARVLATGGANMYSFSPSLVGTALFPINGIQPAKSGRPPIRPNAPCEDQQLPDLHAPEATPPQNLKLGLSTPTARLQWKKARGRAVNWIDRMVRQQHLPLRPAKNIAGTLAQATSPLAGLLGGHGK